MQPHILIVEDDPIVSKLLAFLLAEHGYRVSVHTDPRAVCALLGHESIDLILLDLLLPHGDGFTLCTQVRRAHPDIPVIFLTACGTVDHALESFVRGADDYITKPFEPALLLARLQAVLRRYRYSEQYRIGTLIRVGETTLNLATLAFSDRAHPSVPLTGMEAKVLECLMRNADTVIARTTLIERVWGYDYEGDDDRIEVYIGRLRRKIEADPFNPMYLHTIRGLGYVFRPAQGREGARQERSAVEGGSKIRGQHTSEQVA